MKKSYETLEELLIELDLNPRSRVDVLKKTGKKINTNNYFVVTDDGHCHLFDKDGKLDDISKITTIYESYIRKDIKKIIIPNYVMSIGNYAFEGCSGLTSVTIPDGVTSIGDWAFYGCSGLTNATIPNSVTKIGNCTFLGCNSLTRLTIPASVTSIGMFAFICCSSLRNIVFEGKTMKQVKAMMNYPFGIEDESIVNSMLS